MVDSALSSLRCSGMSFVSANRDKETQRLCQLQMLDKSIELPIIIELKNTCATVGVSIGCCGVLVG
jgi:hypothetical protein